MESEKKTINTENELNLISVNYQDRELAKGNNCKWNPEKGHWYLDMSKTSKSNLDKLIEHQKNHKICFVKNVHKRRSEMQVLSFYKIYIDSHNGDIYEPYTEDEIRALYEIRKTPSPPKKPVYRF